VLYASCTNFGAYSLTATEATAIAALPADHSFSAPEPAFGDIRQAIMEAASSTQHIQLLAACLNSARMLSKRVWFRPDIQ
jgi:hypothetical protein